ncbi:MAG: AAA family ATPase, partial [Planctomycetes bacterium]|nr:AAA family ATPase [Planctomycetota bacterium]
MKDNLPHVPYSPTAEAALIGSLLIDPERIKDLALSPSEFYLETNRWIYEAIQAVRATGKDADYITVCNYLDGKGLLAQIGGAAKIIELQSQVVPSFHVKSYAKIVRELAKRRAVIQDAQILTVAAYNQEADLDQAIAAVMDSLSKTTSERAGAVHISDVISEVYDEVEAAAKNPKDIYGIPTGFPDWDAITYGLQPGTVIKITGEPGVGKSLISMQVLAAAAKAGHPCVLYELEMRRVNVVRRLLSGISHIPTNKMLSGKIEDDEWTLFVQAVEELSALPVYIEANSQLTTADIRADLHRLKKQAGVELAVIDYESLLCDYAPGRDETGLSILRSSRVHGIATDLELAVISLDDMTKEGIAGKGGSNGLAGSARKQHDADEIIFMRRDESKPNLVTLSWTKNREGASRRFFQVMQQST